jgi:hypothetical protein
MSKLIQQKQIEGLTGGALTPSNHKVLDQLVHNIAQDNFTEVTYNGGQPTNIITWTDAGKTLKIRECILTYTNGLVTLSVINQYDDLGVITETLTSTPSYTDGIINNITQVLT